jgi:hypothetical protein
MTVEELREYLNGMPPKAPVVLAADPEGNSFRQLRDKDLIFFCDPAGNEECVEVFKNPAEAKQWKTYEGDVKPCVLLWP